MTKLNRTHKITLAEDHPSAARDTLLETLQFYKISQTEFAKRIGVSQSYISDVLNGKRYLTPINAVAIEDVTGIPASLLLTLDTNYRLWEAKQTLPKPSTSDTDDLFLKPFEWAM
jgi:addiction module HigA family antidote